MQIHIVKKNIVWVLLVVLMVTGILGGGAVYAAEHGEVTRVIAELTEEEKQAKLGQISQQLKEVERELIRLSLLVTKLVLEEQVLVLQQQLAKAQPEGVPEGEIGNAISASADEQFRPDASAAGGSAFGEGLPLAEAGGEEDVFGSISLEDQEEISLESVLVQDEGEAKSGGFLAALGPFRNLGMPELAALSILVVLGLFILVRRFRERKPRASQNVPMKVPEDQPEPSSQSQGSVFQ